LRKAIQCALTAPTGPVSIEIPIDVQQAAYDGARDALAVEAAALPIPAASLLDQIADRIAAARHPLLWVGGGARGASAAVRRLAELGIGVITSTGGRGILAEDHPLSLGAFTQTKATERLYEAVDCMVIAGSHLRSNETRTYALKLPGERYRIDIDKSAENRGYSCKLFVHGDAVAALSGLAERLATRKLAADKGFAAMIAEVRAAAIAETERAIGAYAVLPRTLMELMPRDAIWVRDITLSNSLWGNRLPALHSPRQSVYAMGGGIGQGVPMAIGAALAASGRKTIALAGDGGLSLSLGEIATAVETQADILFILMNDGGYGVIRNIQDAAYGGRRCYTELVAPDFACFAKSLSMPHRAVGTISAIPAALEAAIRETGPRMLEIDMRTIGPLAQNYAGPPGAARA
jgi:acetolactate synthase-1/2/3 large subunit